MKNFISITSLVFLFVMTFESQLNIKTRLADGTLEPEVRVQQTFSGYFKPLSYDAAMKAMRQHVRCVDEENGIGKLCKTASPK